MTDVDGECRTRRVVLPGGVVTWTVLGADRRVVGPAEEFLEYLRVQGTSPNTVKSYARTQHGGCPQFISLLEAVRIAGRGKGRPGVTRHGERARTRRYASGVVGMTGGACGVLVAGVRVGTTE